MLVINIDAAAFLNFVPENDLSHFSQFVFSRCILFSVLQCGHSRMMFFTFFKDSKITSLANLIEFQVSKKSKAGPVLVTRR